MNAFFKFRKRRYNRVDSLNPPLVKVGFQAKDMHSNANKPRFANLYELMDRLAGQLKEFTDGQAMQAVDLARQFAQSRDAAVLAERNRMAREIHDTVAQGIFAVIMQLAVAEEALSRNLPAEATYRIDRACELARETLLETRHSAGALHSKALEKDESV